MWKHSQRENRGISNYIHDLLREVIFEIMWRRLFVKMSKLKSRRGLSASSGIAEEAALGWRSTGGCRRK
jgi:hypothetical protein